MVVAVMRWKGNRAINIAFVALASLICSACFDYAEVIVFKSAWQGHVEIRYSTPVFAETGNSVLGFLPVRKSEIEDYYSRLIFQKKVSEYRVHYLEQNSYPFRQYAQVSFKIPFKNPGELEQILPGKLQVFQKKSRLRLVREFAADEFDEESDLRLIRTYARTARTLLEKRTMRFALSYPPGFLVLATNGQENGKSISYTLDLKSTLEQTQPDKFMADIKAN